MSSFEIDLHGSLDKFHKLSPILKEKLKLGSSVLIWLYGCFTNECPTQSDVPACLFPFDNMDPALLSMQWLSIKWEEWTQSSS